MSSEPIDLWFRPMTADDYYLLFDWLQRPHIKEFWNEGDDTLEKVRRRYDLNDAINTRYILMVQEADEPALAIGYFQHYALPQRVIGIDLFIGNERYINRGIGTQAVKRFIEMIQAKFQPRQIILDPFPENKRAIRCYEKAGFRHYETVPDEDGDTVYMMRLDARRASQRNH